MRASDGYLRTNRRLEWSIAPGSVGQFVAVGENGFVDLLLGDFTRPRKVTNTFAIGSTSRRNERVPWGPNPADAVNVVRGQGWITISSPREGASRVTVVAPEVEVAAARVQAAVVHWVDVQSGFPAPAINPAGSRHVLTTTVLRQTNSCPHAGWIVRYEIVGGPPAGFEPGGAPFIEVPTNEAGQASAAIFQKQAAPGTNQVRVRIFQPAGPGEPAGERVVVRTGSALCTWTAAAVSVRLTGPGTAAVGAVLTYRIEVCNPGDLPARDVVVGGEVPDGLTFLRGTPTPVVSGRRLEWRWATSPPEAGWR